MAVRRAWLAGALPGDSPAAAMYYALNELGPHLFALPGGETARPYGIISITSELARGALFNVVRQGGLSGYNDLTQLSPAADLRDLSLGYFDAFQRESPVAKRLIVSSGLALSYQVWIPSPWSVALMSLAPGRTIRYAKHFAAATARDISAIYNADETTVINVECMMELCSSIAAPNIARSIITRRLVRRITDWIRQCPQGVRFSIHPCFGDYQHRAKCSLPRLGLLVDFVNELVRQWPAGYTLACVHLPLSQGANPPPVEPSWYTSLTRLDMPQGTRVVAGLCHESRTVDELWPIMQLMDTLLRQPVAIGAACGLAPQDEQDVKRVTAVINQQKELCRA